MPELKTVLESVRETAQPGVWDRGVALFAEGAVHDRHRKHDLWFATVQGSRAYQIGFDTRLGAFAARCECPYAHRGWCKHLIAAGLEAGTHPDAWDPFSGAYVPFTFSAQRITSWISGGAAPGYLPLLEQLESEARWLDALLWRLAHHEHDRLTAPKPLSAYGLPALPGDSPSALRKEAVALLFDRWQAMELATEGLLAREGMRYAWPDLARWVQALAEGDAIALQFARTRAEGLGLTV